MIIEEVSDMEDGAARKFRVMCYRRLECGDCEPVTWEQAREERKRLESPNPENFYVIEEA
jgi:hypothetical protein